MKDSDENKEWSYLRHWDVNNFIGWAMSQKLPVNGFKGVEDLCKFGQGFIKSYKGFFLKVEFNIVKNYITFTMIYPFCLKEWKLKKWKTCC